MKLIVALAFTIASIQANNSIAYFQANTILTSFANTLSQRNYFKIDDYFSDNFTLKGCPDQLNKTDFVTVIKAVALPGTVFQFQLLSAAFESNSLVYSFKAFGFGPTFEGEFGASLSSEAPTGFITFQGQALCKE